jgi:O-acetyl-ADP-ribose deacetylase (regulator of RNase III)
MRKEGERFLGSRVLVMTGDITSQAVDAVINAANHSLLGGGGVDGAIHRTGGPAILAACQELRRTRYPDGLPTGEATITPGGRLPARYVIHTVGPVNGRHDGKEADLLAACYHNALALAVQHHLRSLAFPAISTGAFGYPRDKASAVASATIRNFLNNDSTLQEVRLIFFSPDDMVEFLRHQRFS